MQQVQKSETETLLLASCYRGHRIYMNIRIVDNDVYLPVLRELIYEGHSVRLNVRGQSMMPFLLDGRDSVIIEPINRELRKGDIAIFQRQNGTYIMHRIYKVDRENKQCYFVGDAQKQIEGPIETQRVFGIITKAYRRGKWIDSTNFVWWFYDKGWGLIRPFRTRLLLLTISLRQRLKKCK